MIGPTHLPLRQLAAGHFMLPLQPADASWPSAKPQLRWRKLGVDGVVELQVGVKTWWHGKLACNGSEFSKVNEHMLTESSVSAGHAVCAVMSSTPALLDRDLSMKPRALVSGGLSSTSTSRTLPTSSTTSCLKSSTATDGPNQPVDDTRRSFLATWRRFVLRMIKKFEWHARGALLWLVQRAGLRYVPFPYPSVSTCDAWMDQARKMVELPGCLSHRHLDRAIITKAFNAHNLGDAIWLRNRLGVKVAFLEDPLLDGMMAAKTNKGTAQLVRREAYAQAQEQARILAAQNKLEKAARELLGPKGGLPTLKKDLIKLAAFLEQPVDEKATVDQLKGVLRPLVHRLFKEPAGPSSSSQQPPPVVRSQGRIPLPFSPQGRPRSEQRLAAQCGEEALPYLTREEIERVVDP